MGPFMIELRMPFTPLALELPLSWPFGGTATCLNFLLGGNRWSPLESSDFLFTDPPASPFMALILSDGGEEEDPSRNLRVGILGFLASSSFRLQSSQTKAKSSFSAAA